MSDAPQDRARWPAAVALAAAILVGTAGCGDDPFAFRWSDTPDTILLYSLARPELNLVSAFNFFQGVRVQVEAPAATGQWDAAVDTRDGEIVLLVPGVFGVASAARIAPLGDIALEDVTSAPSDTTLYIADRPVPMVEGDVYVIKTNRSRGSFGRNCVYYGKLEPLIADPAAGTLTFRYVLNPVCNSRDLVPPD
jgi:hypothetical protein